MALKPIPRLILIASVIGGLGFAAMKYLQTPEGVAAANSVSQTPANNVAAPMQAPAPAPVQGQAAPASVAVNATGALQSIIEKGVVRAAVQSPAKPFFYKEGGVDKGFNVEFMKLLFGQAEFTKMHPQIVIETRGVDTYPKVPQTLLEKDNRGNPVADIAIDGLTFIDSDLNGVVYSTPYVEDFGYSLVTSSRATIQSIADLSGMTVGVLEGDPDAMAYAKSRLPNSQLVLLSDATVNGERNWMSSALKSGKVDAIIYDYPFAVAEIAGTDLSFALTKMEGSDIKYKIGVRKEDSALLGALNVAIAKAKEDPRYADLIRKYFMSKNVAAVRGAAGGEVMYTVKQGDTLAKIAANQLGNAMRYTAIQSRNNLANPNLIYVGQGLVIPK